MGLFKKTPPRTTVDPDTRAWAQGALGHRVLTKIEDGLRHNGMDPDLTEEEVLLAGPAAEQASANSTAILISAISLSTAYIGILFTVWGAGGIGEYAGLKAVGSMGLTCVFGAVIVWSFVTVYRARIPAGVKAVAESRHTRGTLHRSAA